MACSADGGEGYEEEWFMPDENAPHQRTWMAFGASERIWGRRLLPEVRRNLATIAKAIARYEPVSMLVRESEYEKGMDPILFHVVNEWLKNTWPFEKVVYPGRE